MTKSIMSLLPLSISTEELKLHGCPARRAVRGGSGRLGTVDRGLLTGRCELNGEAVKMKRRMIHLLWGIIRKITEIQQRAYRWD
jgi:hypothetical protein